MALTPLNSSNLEHLALKGLRPRNRDEHRTRMSQNCKTVDVRLSPHMAEVSQFAAYISCT